MAWIVLLAASRLGTWTNREWGAIRTFRLDRRERSGGSPSTRPILTKIADLMWNTTIRPHDCGLGRRRARLRVGASTISNKAPARENRALGSTSGERELGQGGDRGSSAAAKAVGNRCAPSLDKRASSRRMNHVRVPAGLMSLPRSRRAAGPHAEKRERPEACALRSGQPPTARSPLRTRRESGPCSTCR